ncbi:reverse transcriptase domain-containing protein [Tanacetum coccineum]|uniref:Reverse transcriptase domain-containing protein n=1 Tax=Tanacetum coccineum TaxID=301880 RepID=A0ABQ4WI29_9ASTR
MMYLAVTNEAVSAVLLTERDGRQMPIHYITRSLQGAETNYAPMEKLALALVHAAIRLREAISKLTTRSSLTGQPNRASCWDNSRRQEGSAIKGQVVNNPWVEDILESSNARDGSYSWPERAWNYISDGAHIEGSVSRPHLISSSDEVYPLRVRLNFSNSNNDAEYEALLDGLRIANEMQVKDIHAFVDSKLVASQVEGKYKAKGERMIKYREKVLELAGAFNRFRITHIPRAEIRKADALSKLAAVQFNHLSKEVLV